MVEYKLRLTFSPFPKILPKDGQGLGFDTREIILPLAELLHNALFSMPSGVK